MKLLFPLLALALSAMPAAAAPIEVHGHRGARWSRAENTLPAFQFALEVKADWLELDTAVTKDGVVVVTHDPRLNRKLFRAYEKEQWKEIPAPAKLIKDLQWAEVQRFGCGFPQVPEPGKTVRFPHQMVMPGTRMASLRELLQMLDESPLPHAQKIGLNIELKIEPGEEADTVGPNALAVAVMGVLRGHEGGKYLARTIVQSFSPKALEAARELNVGLQKEGKPEVRLSYLVQVSEGQPEPSEKEREEREVAIVAKCLALGAVILSPQYEPKPKPGNLTTASLRARTRAAHLQLVPWTANGEAEWTELRDLEVDGIITDDPEGCLKFLGR